MYICHQHKIWLNYRLISIECNKYHSFTFPTSLTPTCPPKVSIILIFQVSCADFDRNWSHSLVDRQIRNCWANLYVDHDLYLFTSLSSDKIDSIANQSAYYERISYLFLLRHMVKVLAIFSPLNTFIGLLPFIVGCCLITWPSFNTTWDSTPVPYNFIYSPRRGEPFGLALHSMVSRRL